MASLLSKLSAPAGYSTTKVATPSAVLSLAFQSLGVIYGDIGTSPLYVFASIFATKPPTKEEVLGVTSLIFWTITLIVLVEYVFVILRADDNGEGGTFALYSLICRKANINAYGNTAAEDQQLSTYSRGLGASSIPFVTDRPQTVSETIIKLLQKKKWAREVLTVMVLFTASMVLGDGVLTPAISGAVIGITCAIIIGLFMVQKYGTAQMGRAFAPIVLTWFMSNVCIAVYNINKYDSAIFRVISPHHAINFLRTNGMEGFFQLGGVFLCITGAEAMYADLGHFTRVPVQVSFSFVVYPSLILTYLGQAAWLTHHLDEVGHTFYSSIPTPMFWPMLVIATLASIVASQAVISAAYSLFRQSIALGYFPRLNVVHTSSVVEGQIYIPEVSWAMMIMTIAVVAGFQDGTSLGNAYGIAVCLVMLSTVMLVSVVMLIVWKVSVPLTTAFYAFFASILLIFLATLMRRVPEGGWFAVSIGAVATCVTGAWCVGSYTKNAYLSRNKWSKNSLLKVESIDFDKADGPNAPVVVNRLTGKPLIRVPGLALLYTETTQGLPLVFVELVKRLGIMHQFVVFVTVRTVTVPKVPETERLVFQQLDLPGAFRCIARYGYMEQIDHGEQFVALILARIKALASESLATVTISTNGAELLQHMESTVSPLPSHRASQPSMELQKHSRLPKLHAQSKQLCTLSIVPVDGYTNDALQPSPMAPRHSLQFMADPAFSCTTIDAHKPFGFSPSAGLGLAELEPDVCDIPAIEGLPETEAGDGSSDMGLLLEAAVRWSGHLGTLQHPVQYIFLSPTLSAGENESIVTRVLLHHVYNTIKRNAQKPHQRWGIPLEGLVEIGIVMKV